MEKLKAKYEVVPLTFESGNSGFGVIAYAPVARLAAVQEEWMAEALVKLLEEREEARVAEAAEEPEV